MGTSLDFSRSTFGPVPDGLVFGQRPNSNNFLWISDNNLYPKFELVIGQMGQNIRFLDKCPKHPKSELNGSDLGQLGPKLLGLSPNGRIPNVLILDRFGITFKA